MKSENSGLRLALQAGSCFEKHLQAHLRVSFAKQFQHSRSESTPVFSLFLSVYIFPIRG